MNLENWRSLNYLTQELIVLQLCLSVGYALRIYNKKEKKLKPIFYFLFGSLIFDLTSATVLKFDPNASYFKFVDYYYLSFEFICLYWYFYELQKPNVTSRIFTIVNLCIFIVFMVYNLSLKDSNAEHFSVLASFVNTIFLFFNVYLLIKKNMSSTIWNKAAFQIALAFIVSYSVLISVFFTLPIVIEYSRILANQIIIFKNIISIIFYLIIIYAIGNKKDFI